MSNDTGMERISELLDAIGQSAGQFGTSNAPIYRWAIEATNRLQELQYKVDATERLIRDVMEHHGLSAGL